MKCTRLRRPVHRLGWPSPSFASVGSAGPHQHASALAWGAPRASQSARRCGAAAPRSHASCSAAGWPGGCGGALPHLRLVEVRTTTKIARLEAPSRGRQHHLCLLLILDSLRIQRLAEQSRSSAARRKGAARVGRGSDGCRSAHRSPHAPRGGSRWGHLQAGAGRQGAICGHGRHWGRGWSLGLHTAAAAALRCAFGVVAWIVDGGGAAAALCA